MTISGISDDITPWTRLMRSALWNAAETEYGRDPRRAYHNFDHVRRMYRHAEETFGFAYDLELDKAILSHDVVIDGLPRQEVRSIAWLSDRAGVSAVAGGLIMTTIHHRIGSDNRLILLDLADFLDPEQSRLNTDMLRIEASELMGWDDVTFREKTVAYLTGIEANIADDIASVSDPRQVVWWNGISLGIQMTIRQLSSHEPDQITL